MDKQKRQSIEARLEAIRADNGGILTPDAVLRDAAKKASPLHDQFDWSDKDAAHKWRLTQARALIRSVQIEVRTERSILTVPMYVRDADADAAEQGYRATVEIKTDADLAADTLRDEFSRTLANLERMAGIAEAIGMRGEMDALLIRVRMVRDLMMSPTKAEAARPTQAVAQVMQ